MLYAWGPVKCRFGKMIHDEETTDGLIRLLRSRPLGHSINHLLEIVSSFSRNMNNGRLALTAHGHISSDDMPIHSRIRGFTESTLEAVVWVTYPLRGSRNI